MSPATITLLFLLFAIVMFVWEKIPLGVTSMIICVGLVVTGVLDFKTAFAGFIDSNVILFVAMFIVGGALFETGMANKIGGNVRKGLDLSKYWTLRAGKRSYLCVRKKRRLHA